MSLAIIAIMLVFAGGFGLGFAWNVLWRQVAGLAAKISELELRKKDIAPPEEQQKSMVLDPDDVIQQARLEHEQQMRDLNGD